jgi:hypothetical protein
MDRNEDEAGGQDPNDEEPYGGDDDDNYDDYDDQGMDLSLSLWTTTFLLRATKMTTASSSPASKSIIEQPFFHDEPRHSLPLLF